MHRALSVLAPVHRAGGFARARLPGLPAAGGGLEAVAALTAACLGAGGLAEEAEGSWAAEASDLLLDAWVELLLEHAIGTCRHAPWAPWMYYYCQEYFCEHACPGAETARLL